MKIVTASNGKKTIKISKKEWLEIGKKTGWKVEAHGGYNKYLEGWNNYIDNQLFAQLLHDLGQETHPKIEDAKIYLKNLIDSLVDEMHEHDHHTHEHEEHGNEHGEHEHEHEHEG